MAAHPVPKPNFALPIVERDGTVALWFRKWITAMHDRTGGPTDKVDQAATLAANAVPQGTQVVASGGLQNGGSLGGNVGLTLYKAIGALASLPVLGNAIGDHAFALDACKPGESSGSGSGVPVFWQSGSPGAWFSLCSGAAATT